MKRYYFIIHVLLFSLILATNAQGEVAHKDIIIKDAWVRAMPPSFTHTAAYLTIMNNSSQDLVLVSVTTEAAKTAELHTMMSVDGKMVMSQLNLINISPQGRVELKPEGKHIMLIDLVNPLNIGAEIPLLLEFKNGLTIEVMAEIRMDQKQTKGSSHKGSHMKGSMHDGH